MYATFNRISDIGRVKGYSTVREAEKIITAALEDSSVRGICIVDHVRPPPLAQCRLMARSAGFSDSEMPCPARLCYRMMAVGIGGLLAPLVAPKPTWEPLMERVADAVLQALGECWRIRLEAGPPPQ
jgi:hypothetical protein